MLIIEKLEKLGATKAHISVDDMKREFAKIESMVGALPVDYKKMIYHFGKEVSFSAEVFFSADVPSPWTDKDGLDELDFFYGLVSKTETSTLFWAISTYRGRLPNDWLPIGSAPGGNLLCLNLKADHPVAFWDHESEGIPSSTGEGGTSRGNGLSLAAPSLEDFCSRLHPAKKVEKKINVKMNLRF